MLTPRLTGYLSESVTTLGLTLLCINDSELRNQLTLWQSSKTWNVLTAALFQMTKKNHLIALKMTEWYG